MNLNDKVRVQLTARGKQILHDKGLTPHDNEKYLDYQLWEFMEIFGKYMHIGFHEQIIKDNEIEILEC